MLGNLGIGILTVSNMDVNSLMVGNLGVGRRTQHLPCPDVMIFLIGEKMAFFAQTTS
jgi:hypothetical protein